MSTVCQQLHTQFHSRVVSVLICILERPSVELWHKGQLSGLRILIIIPRPSTRSELGITVYTPADVKRPYTTQNSVNRYHRRYSVVANLGSKNTSGHLTWLILAPHNAVMSTCEIFIFCFIKYEIKTQQLLECFLYFVSYVTKLEILPNIERRMAG
jgi:hypothetical protein